MIYEDDPEGVLRWMQARHEMIYPKGKYHCLGCVLDNRLIAGLLYDGWDGNQIWMSIVSTDPRWCSRGNLQAIFGYPFLIAGAKRVSAFVSRDNERSLKLCAGFQTLRNGLGFTIEGVMRKGYPDGSDGIVLGMLREECKWI